MARAFDKTVVVTRAARIAVILGRAAGANIEGLTRVAVAVLGARAGAAAGGFPVVTEDGANVGFAVLDRLRAEMLHRVGFADLLTPARLK